MTTKTLKALMSLIMGLSALFYVLQNFANIDAAYEVIGYVLSGADHVYYPDSFAFFIEAPWLVWLALTVIFAFELLCGILLVIGAWSIWQNRYQNREDFIRAKQLSQIGFFVGFFVWGFLFFSVGGGFFNMWQTEIGAGSLADATKFATLMGIGLLFVSQPES